MNCCTVYSSLIISKIEQNWKICNFFQFTLCTSADKIECMTMQKIVAKLIETYMVIYSSQPLSAPF